MTTQQKLLNLWVAQNYDTLLKEMPMRDMLHSAYITVFQYRRPIIPTPDVFAQLMNDAYHRHLLAEFNHTMHYVLPDPLFWFYADEQEEILGLTDNDADCTPSHSMSDLSAYSMKQLFSFVKSHFSQEVFDIFKMAVVEQHTYSEIASITGRSKQDIRRIIDDIEQAIRQCRRVKESRD